MISSMKGLISGVFEYCRRNGVFNLGVIPGTVTIRVYHAQTPYEVVVPSNSNFGYVKSIVSQAIGVKPEMCKIIFGDVEREDSESLREAGAMNNLGVLFKVIENDEKITEEVQETSVMSKGEDAVAEVRKEVDMIAPQVSVLEVFVDNGIKVDDKIIGCLSEMLMSQLLSLDGIEAEGEAKNQRRMEVRRIQSIVESLDVLKSRNRSSVKDTQSRAPNSSCQSAHTPSPMSFNTTPTPSSVPHYQAYYHKPASSTLSSTQCFSPLFNTTSTPSSVPHNEPYHKPASSLLSHLWNSNS